MLENTPAQSKRHVVTEERQVKAMLRLVEDLGYEVLVGSNGEWTVSQKTDLGDRTIVGVDNARTVATAARRLASALQADRKPTALHTTAG